MVSFRLPQPAVQALVCCTWPHPAAQELVYTDGLSKQHRPWLNVDGLIQRAVKALVWCRLPQPAAQVLVY